MEFTEIVYWIACAALGIPFVWLGYEAASEPGARVAMAAKLGIPRPEWAVRLNGAAMVAGGVALVVHVCPMVAGLVTRVKMAYPDVGAGMRHITIPAGAGISGCGAATGGSNTCSR